LEQRSVNQSEQRFLDDGLGKKIDRALFHHSELRWDAPAILGSIAMLEFL